MGCKQSPRRWTTQGDTPKVSNRFRALLCEVSFDVPEEKPVWWCGRPDTTMRAKRVVSANSPRTKTEGKRVPVESGIC